MTSNICRICMGRESLLSIFQKMGVSSLAQKIMSIAKVHILNTDGLPRKICSICTKKLNDCLEFIELCEKTDSELRLVKNKKHTICTEADDSTSQNENSSSPKSDVYIDIDVEVSEVKESFNNKKTQKQQCFTCGKVMSSRFRLKTHLITHTGERPYKCSYCNKTFSLSQSLKVHIRTHTGEKPLQCSICGESFAHTAGLAAHKRKHTGVLPYQCVLCPRSFRTVGHLQYHTRRHTGEKNFECDTCGRPFITRSDLKQHILTHTGERPHVCCVCGMRLTRASHLKRHMQQIHNGQKTKPNDAVIAENND